MFREPIVAEHATCTQTSSKVTHKCQVGLHTNVNYERVNLKLFVELASQCNDRDSYLILSALLILSVSLTSFLFSLASMTSFTLL